MVDYMCIVWHQNCPKQNMWIEYGTMLGIIIFFVIIWLIGEYNYKKKQAEL